MIQDTEQKDTGTSFEYNRNCGNVSSPESAGKGRDCWSSQPSLPGERQTGPSHTCCHLPHITKWANGIIETNKAALAKTSMGKCRLGRLRRSNLADWVDVTQKPTKVQAERLGDHTVTTPISMPHTNQWHHPQVH